ncbi:replicative DNA helicase [Candidatus Saccharibacteria bacterium]|nr:replicative DNA helicase [Candidatus Saccharibacteria bacterium]
MANSQNYSKTVNTIKKNSVTLPPQNAEAESSLIGSLLIDKDGIIKVADIVATDDFYVTKNSQIFEAILGLFERREPIDVITLADSLEKNGHLEDVGGAAYLTELVNSVPSSAHVAQYAHIVAEKATLRRLIDAASSINSMAYAEGDALDSVLDEAEQTLFAVSQKHLKQNFTPIQDVLTQSFERLDSLHKDKTSLRGIPTGYRALDNLLAGLQNSDLIILAARPSMGKTSLALNIAQHVATKEGIPVGIFSLEMSKEQLIDRLLSSEAGIDSWKLRTGNLEDSDFEKINKAMGTLSESPIYIDDSAMANVMEMRTKARRLQSENDLGLIIIDYLQLMSGRNSGGDNRVQEISEISRGLKGLARELNVPVIALSQLSRSVEMRSPKIPQLSDLRESGSIEQDADVVMFIYREDYYEKDSDRKSLADILVRKHRNGPTGEVELYFQPELMLFRNVDNVHKE